MNSESMKQQLREQGPIPGLSEWLNREVLRLRCSDITKEQFLAVAQKIHHAVESLFNESLPESMETETYLVAQEYYDAAADSLDSHLSGIEAVLDWLETFDDQALAEAKAHLARGDKLAQEVMILALEAQESFRQTEEALMQSLGVKREGIE